LDIFRSEDLHSYPFGSIIEAEAQDQTLPGACAPHVASAHEAGMARLRGIVALVLQKHFSARP
jgi:hypothetical protein